MKSAAVKSATTASAANSAKTIIPGLCCIFCGVEELPASLTCTWGGRGGEHVL